MTRKYLIGIGWSESFEKDQMPDVLCKDEMDIVKLGKLAAVFYVQAKPNASFLRKTHHQLVLDCCRCGTFLPAGYNDILDYDSLIKDLRKNHEGYSDALKSIEGYIEIAFHISWVKPGGHVSQNVAEDTWSGHNYLRYRKGIQQELATVKKELKELRSFKKGRYSQKYIEGIEHLIFTETAPDELTGIVSLERGDGQVVALKLETSIQKNCPSAVKTKVVGPMPPYYMAKNIYQRINL